MSCIGTAGHVDHGKSTLVRALTGIDPDRLAEEKERGMTIDLGFAWLTLPHGREVSIVDVPGHESFIKNMLAGVGGIDAALLVIAADEGVMPQTREHLAILNLLGVQRGIVVLTKADLADEEWLELVREDVRELLQPTTLATAPILPVSAMTGQGLPSLLAELERMLDQAEERQDIARPRLPVDRVFTLTGFGTVVTGTLLDGHFMLGQEVEVLPEGLASRIRGLQTHRTAVERAHPGSRVAINLAGISRADLVRGSVVALPGQLRPTVLLDAHLHLLSEAARPLIHNTQVDFYSGSQEIPARVRLLDTNELQPGQSGWIQLRLSKPAVVARRDRFILRIPSPSTTIGGGEIVDTQPRYHRRYQSSVLERLTTLERGTDDELLLAILDRRLASAHTSEGQQRVRNIKAVPTGYELKEIVKLSHLSEDVTLHTLQSLQREGRVRQVNTLWFAESVWHSLVTEAIQLVQEHHQRYPLRSGISKEEWRTKLHLSPKLATDVLTILQNEGKLEPVNAVVDGPTGGGRGITGSGTYIRQPGFVPRFTTEQQQQMRRLFQRFQEQPYTPPVRSEAESLVGGEVLNSLIEQGQLVKLGDDVLFLRDTYEEAIAKVVAYLQEHQTITVAEARDILGTTRKYILPLLEHMDMFKITRRIGDERVLGQRYEAS